MSCKACKPSEPVDVAEFATPAAHLKRVVVTSSRFKPVAHPLASELAESLRGLGVDVTLDLPGTAPLAETAKNANLIIAVGGDGTLLATARRLVGTLTPTLGVNLGKLGFLAEHSPAEVRAYLAGAAPDGWHFSPKMMLQVALNGSDDHHYALNEVFIGQGVMTRLLDLDLSVDGQHATQYRADSLVVSTPVGSTAYTLSLGGPIVSQGLRAFVITPVAPHTLTNRPIVIEGSSKVTCTVQTQAEELALIVDSQERLALEPGDCFTVSAAPTDFLLVSSGQRSYFDTLRHKLAWGQQPVLSDYGSAEE